MHSMKNRLLPLLVLFLFLAAFISPAQIFIPESQAQTASINVFIDGAPLVMDTPPIIDQGRTLVPLRAIFEALGAEVNWNGANQSITASKDDLSLYLQIGSRNAVKNGVPVMLDVPPQIVNSRTLVPLRFVGETLGADVDWEGTTRTVLIVSKAAAPGIPEEPAPGEPTSPDPEFVHPIYQGIADKLSESVKEGLYKSFDDPALRRCCH
jgi:iron complex transport system substrate-binding protein